ncbi:hypothetical protein AURDEDRAFT_178362 [Auricularia subglabra TFB-10046 SS5]|uniref:Uncharacterized protein n=1 Tax=Auricularia subglabra (strain TFB-10046 / SS5) TaxID=717982 RepID=J0WLB1_AURST|nr:hypothetical protein AURDEDRAFT_178362 [Auricularia subglabra TFB-10046 SS5]
MGMKRLGFGGTPAAAATPNSARTAKEDEEASTYARQKFGSQKAISSDMYFERNSYSPALQAEAKERLTNFQGATSISSNQYFGREEPEDNDAMGANGESWETTARDVVQRVMSNPDVQNAADSIRAGAMKLSEYLAQMGER